VKGAATARELVTRVRDKLLRANVRILGVVLNDLPADPSTSAEYRAYGGYYGDAASRSAVSSSPSSAGTAPVSSAGSASSASVAESSPGLAEPTV
jgi:Mrp family chromosome partitioning ATPase